MAEPHSTPSSPAAGPCSGETSGAPGPRREHGPSILLNRVTKLHSGQRSAAVAGLTLDVPAGGVVALVGPPGCGKTTALRMVNRLVHPSSGRVLVDGRDVADMDERALRRGIGYTVRTGGLFPHMTVAANTGLVPGMLGWKRRRTAARVSEMLELVGLDPAADGRKYPAELSVGQHERVGMARALAASPRVLLLDDPFGAVDPATRHGLQQDLLRIQAHLRMTVICATRDLTEALVLGDRVAVLDRGARLVRYGSPEQVCAACGGERTADSPGSIGGTTASAPGDQGGTRGGRR